MEGGVGACASIGFRPGCIDSVARHGNFIRRESCRLARSHIIGGKAKFGSSMPRKMFVQLESISSTSERMYYIARSNCLRPLSPPLYLLRNRKPLRFCVSMSGINTCSNSRGAPTVLLNRPATLTYWPWRRKVAFSQSRIALTRHSSLAQELQVSAGTHTHAY